VAARAAKLLSAELSAGKLDPVHAANLLWAAAALAPGSTDDAAEGGENSTSDGTCESEGAQQNGSSDWMQQIAPAVARVIDEMSAEAAVHSVWALGKLGIDLSTKDGADTDSSITAADDNVGVGGCAARIAARLEALAPEFAGAERSHRLSSAVWAWAKLGLHTGTHPAASALREGELGTVLAEAMPTLDNKHLWMVAWGLARSFPTLTSSKSSKVKPCIADKALHARMKEMAAEDLAEFDWKSVARIELWLRRVYVFSPNPNATPKP
jgi:hypothetical protein